MGNPKNIVEEIKKHPNERVRVAFADIDGILRGKIIHKKKFLDSIEDGFGFCDVVFGWDSSDVCYDNVEVTGWHTAYPDAKARLDLNSYRKVPWNENQPFFIADFSTDEQMSRAACPRSLLKRVRNQANEMGYKPMFSQEFEWFNFLGKPNDLTNNKFSKLQPITPGMFGYSQLRPTEYQEYFNDIFDMMLQFNVPLEGMHTETGPGVYEAAICNDEILEAADKAILFKNGVKEIAYKYGIVASFMAKWNNELPGCGGHIHQSLWDLDGKRNVFYNDEAPGVMNDTLKQYVAGLLHCMPQIMPMWVPNINSYKRLVDGAWAPTTVSWGIDNRTTTVRLLGGKEKSTRIEMRLPGSDSNAYLAMAASLAAGLFGIKNKLDLEQIATKGNAYAEKGTKFLPTNLWEATQKMKESSIANELFGEAFVKHFCATREWEWRQHEKAVTDWELKRYFEII